MNSVTSTKPSSRVPAAEDNVQRFAKKEKLDRLVRELVNKLVQNPQLTAVQNCDEWNELRISFGDFPDQINSVVVDVASQTLVRNIDVQEEYGGDESPESFLARIDEIIATHRAVFHAAFAIASSVLCDFETYVKISHLGKNLYAMMGFVESVKAHLALDARQSVEMLQCCRYPYFPSVEVCFSNVENIGKLIAALHATLNENSVVWCVSAVVDMILNVPAFLDEEKSLDGDKNSPESKSFCEMHHNEICLVLKRACEIFARNVLSTKVEEPLLENLVCIAENCLIIDGKTTDVLGALLRIADRPSRFDNDAVPTLARNHVKRMAEASLDFGSLLKSCFPVSREKDLGLIEQCLLKQIDGDETDQKEWEDFPKQALQYMISSGFASDAFMLTRKLSRRDDDDDNNSAKRQKLHALRKILVAVTHESKDLNWLAHLEAGDVLGCAESLQRTEDPDPTVDALRKSIGMMAAYAGANNDNNRAQVLKNITRSRFLARANDFIKRDLRVENAEELFSALHSALELSQDSAQVDEVWTIAVCSNVVVWRNTIAKGVAKKGDAVSESMFVRLAASAVGGRKPMTSSFFDGLEANLYARGFVDRNGPGINPPRFTVPEINSLRILLQHCYGNASSHRPTSST